MKPKTFGFLIVIFCIVGLAAYFTLKQDRPRDLTRMGAQLFADLPINDVAHIQVEGPAGGVTLKKGPGAWVVQERFGYPADFDKISGLVKKIRGLKVGRTFRADRKVRQRLSLLLPDESGKVPAEQIGTRLILTDKDGGPLADILVGKARQAGAGGHHLMKLEPPANDTVYLVGAPFQLLRTDPDDWLLKDLLDVKSEEVRQVDCFDMKNGGLVYRILRPENGDAAVLQGLAETESGDPAKIDRVFGALSGLALDGVGGGRGSVDLAAMENPRRFEYHLFNGTAYTLETAKITGADGDENYLTVSVSHTSPEPPRTEEADAKVPDAAPSDNGDPAQEAQRLDDKVRPWTYTISTWKYEGFVSDRTRLLQSQG